MQENISARYEQAKTILQGLRVNPLVLNDKVFAHWINNSHCFWYERKIKEGKEFQLVDAEEAISTLAFDHQALARALSELSKESINPCDLPITDVVITSSPFKMHFQALGKRWIFELDNSHLEEYSAAQQDFISPDIENVAECFHQVERTQEIQCSPDGKKAAFVRDHNLWVRDQATGEEQALTQDGTAEYYYSGSLLGMDASVQVLWSPDSKRLFTLQLDSRNVTTRPLINYAPQNGDVSPQLMPTKMPYPGDEHVETLRLLVIEVSTGNLQEVDYAPMPALDIFGFFNGKPFGWWSPDSRRAFFIDVTRGSKAVRVVELDTFTGTTRVLFEETSDTFVRLSHSLMGVQEFLPLPESDELIWFSERSGWAHLYLYDLKTGELKHPITEGDWLVRGILHYDANKREILLQTAGRNAGINPYYRDVCKVNIDSGELTSLVSGCFDYRVYHPFSHAVLEFIIEGLESEGIDGVSPCGQYLVITYSRVDTAPVSVLIDRDGREILTLETADVSGLPTGWHWPQPVKLKGSDNQTDIYGVVFRPPGFSEEKRYPVVDYSCSQRSMSTLPLGSFVNSAFFGFDFLSAAALSALGFIVVVIEGRGLPLRNKAFADHHYGDIAYANDFSDRIAGLHQLAKRYPFMDLEHVGITGHENQSNNVFSLLKHSDFYKVAVVNCLFDPRFNFTGETYDNTADKTITTNTRPEDCVDSFSGKLLLIQGMMSHLTPAGTFRLVEALQKANKNFDMLCLPNLVNFVTGYTYRREWDYLVTHLQGIEPPKDFHLTTGIPGMDAV